MSVIPTTGEAKARVSPQVQGQPDLHTEALSQKKKKDFVMLRTSLKLYILPLNTLLVLLFVAYMYINIK